MEGMTLQMESILDQARVPKNKAGWRNVIGNIAEEIAAQKLNAERLHTGMREHDHYCPDLRAGQVHYEVKAVGLSRQMIVYRMRLEKDRDFAQTHTLCYAIIRHDFGLSEMEKCLNAGDCRYVMQFTARIWIIPFRYLDGICAGIEPRKFNYKDTSHGTMRNGYELGGWCIPLKTLIAACPHGRIA